MTDIDRRHEGTNDLFGELATYSSERAKLASETMTLGEYFNKITENPRLARNSFQYILDTVSQPEFFTSGKHALFGIEKTTNQLTEVLKGGAKGLEIGRRILLLMGPPGGGKTSLVEILKAGMESYSLTPEGALYGIKDCPMHEDPLKLIPETLREQFLGKYGITVEGDLCPQCKHEYKNKNIADLRSAEIVHRVLLSKSERVGIGNFKPSDPKSQDITELVGSVDFSKLSEYGVSSDPRAYRFDGELNIANRGLMEFVEMLKIEPQFLYATLDLSQSRVIKPPRFADISADLVIVAHTNQTEYDNFMKKKENEAMQDRIIIIPVPYNLRVSDEVKIYSKLVADAAGQGEGKVHLAPLALKTAATFAVLSRLAKENGISAMSKLRGYNGEYVEDLTPEKIKELQEKRPDEGMEGVSPRFVIDCLSQAIIKKDTECLTPPNVLRALREGMAWHTNTREYTKEQKDAFHSFVSEARKDYDEAAKTEVQRAFVYSYEESAKNLFKNYLDNIRAYSFSRKLKDPVTGDDVQADEKLMRKIETQIGIDESSKKAFRDEILRSAGDLSADGKSFDYKSHTRLNDAIEKTLFADLKDVIKITTNTRNPDPEQLAKINSVAATLMEKGYCATCANDLLKYVGTLLNR
ncbi:MAG: protein prkA [Microgenomates group bacterium]|jgi:serine protein kinase